MLILAAELADFGKPMEKMFTDLKKIKGSLVSQYDLKVAVKKLLSDAHETDQRLEKDLFDEATKNAPAFGIKITKGLHASKDALVFSSTEEALKHLANITGSKIMVASKEEDEEDED